MLRATSTSASERSSASIRSTIQFEPLVPWTENIVRSAPCACGGEALGLAEDAGVIDERAEEAGRDRHVRGVEVLDPLLVLEDRRRAPAVVAPDVLVEDADDRRGAAGSGMRVGSSPTVPRSVVPLPSDVRSPFIVYLNGVRAGAGRRLPGRRTARSSSSARCARTRSAAGAGCSAPGASGTYRQDDSVDVRWTRADGTPAVAERLEIEQSTRVAPAAVSVPAATAAHGRLQPQRAEDRARRGRAVQRVEVDARARRRRAARRTAASRRRRRSSATASGVVRRARRARARSAVGDRPRRTAR